MFAALRSLPDIVPGTSARPTMAVLDADAGLWLALPERERSGLGDVIRTPTLGVVVRRVVGTQPYTIEVEALTTAAPLRACADVRLVVEFSQGETGPWTQFYGGTYTNAEIITSRYTIAHWLQCWGEGQLQFPPAFDPARTYVRFLAFALEDGESVGTALATSAPFRLVEGAFQPDEPVIPGLPPIKEALEDAVALVKWLAVGGVVVGGLYVAGPFLVGATRNARATYKAARGE